MGNCSSSSARHVQIDRQRRVQSAPKRKNITKKGDKEHQQDTTESSTSEADAATLPMSPDSTLAFVDSPLKYSKSPFASPSSPSSRQVSISLSSKLQQQQQQQASTTTTKTHGRSSPSRSSPSSSNNGSKKAFSSSPPSSPSRSSNRAKSRALKARLEKARYMQQQLLTLSSASASGASASPHNNNSKSFDKESSNTWDESSDSSEQQQQQIPAQYSTASTSVSTSTSSSLNDEFEATISSGMIWAELDAPDKVSAVAISRQKATITLDNYQHHDVPPLFLAIGTDDGTVMVTEILQPEKQHPLQLATAAGTAAHNNNNINNKKRLGKTLTLQRRTATRARVRSLDFHPDGYHLAVGGDDCSCAIVRLVYKTQKTQKEEDHSEKLVGLELVGEVQRVDRVYAVQFNPDGRYLAIGGFDGTVAIVTRKEWAVSKTPEVLVEIPRDSLIFDLDWSPDSRYLAIACSDKCCAIVDVDTSWSVFKEIRRPGTVQTVKWYPNNNGKYLAIGSTNVAIVDRSTFTVKHEIDLQSSSNSPDSSNKVPRRRSVYKVNSVCWSPNGSYFVICGSDKKCSMLETKTFTTVHEMHRSDNVTSVVWGQQSIVSGVPRRYLAIGGDDKKVVILKAGLELNRAASSIGDDLSSSASSFISNKSDWTLKENAFRDFNDTTTDESTFAFENSDDEGSRVIAVAFSRGSKTRRSTFFAYAMDDGLVIVHSTIDWKIVAELRFSIPILSLSFSNGSRFLALASAGSKVFVVETAPTWSVITTKEFDAPVNTIAFSRYNERLAVGVADGILALLDPSQNYNAAGEIDNNDSPVLAIDWSSKNFAAGRQDGTVAIYDTTQVCSNFCVPLADLERNSPIRAVAFGVSSRFLAVGGDDGVIGVYSAKGGWVLCHQVRGPSGLSSLVWSASGHYLAFGGSDCPLRVVDTMFWADVQEANTHAEESTGRDHPGPRMAFSQDGKTLAFTSKTDGTRVVDTSKWQLVFSLQGDETEALTKSLSSGDEDGRTENGDI